MDRCLAGPGGVDASDGGVDRDRLLPRGGSRENALDEEEEEDRADGERGRGLGPTPEADTLS